MPMSWESSWLEEITRLSAAISLFSKVLPCIMYYVLIVLLSCIYMNSKTLGSSNTSNKRAKGQKVTRASPSHSPYLKLVFCAEPSGIEQVIAPWIWSGLPHTLMRREDAETRRGKCEDTELRRCEPVHSVAALPVYMCCSASQ